MEKWFGMVSSLLLLKLSNEKQQLNETQNEFQAFLKCDTLMGKHDFRPLVINQYYKIKFDAVYIYHFFNME